MREDLHALLATISVWPSSRSTICCSSFALHPEWREELHRVLLTDSLLALPETVARLAERMDQLAERMDQLAEAQLRTEEHISVLAVRVDRMGEDVRTLKLDIATLKGRDTERQYRDLAFAYFGPIARGLHTLTPDELQQLLEPALEAGILSDTEELALRRADAIVRGRRAGELIYLVVEASSTVEVEDVHRADERARLLARLGVTTLAIVAGEAMSPDAGQAAVERGAWRVTDDRVLDPAAA